MSTIIRIGSFRVVIYPNDHRPAHVHVIGNGCEAIFCLNCPGGPVSLRESYGFARRAVNEFAVHLNSTLEILCSRWRNIHGRYL